MTLDGMNAYLRDKGFEVNRERDSKRDCYVFTIRKPGYEAMTRDFKYPKSDDWKYKNEQMEKFLNQMVRDFYKGEEKTMFEREAILRVQGRDVPVVIDRITESMCEATRFECWVRDFQHIGDMFNTPSRLPTIENVIYNDPATIVFWADGTKTVVKCQEGYQFDPMAGLSMAICEKAFGSKANSHKVFNKWLPKEEKVDISKELSRLEAECRKVDRRLSLIEAMQAVDEFGTKFKKSLEDLMK